MNDTSFKIRQAVISEIESYYNDGIKERANKDNVFEAVCQVWTDCSNDNEASLENKVLKTLTCCVEFLNSKDSPFSTEERNSREFKQIIDAIKPEGLLHQDLKKEKFSNSDIKQPFMVQFSNYMSDLSRTAMEGGESGKETAKKAIVIFPPQDVDDYNCVPGSRSRIAEAQSTLMPPYAAVVRQSYLEAVFPLNLQARKTVGIGNQVHIQPAIDYMMGVNKKAIEQVDRFYYTPVKDLSSSDVWQAFEKTVTILPTIKEKISLTVQAVIDGSDPKNDILIPTSSQEHVLKPWGIDAVELLEDFYTEDYKIKRLSTLSAEGESVEETDQQVVQRVSDAVMEKMSDRINEHIFGPVATERYIPWGNLSDDRSEQIPDFKTLCSDEGKRFIIDDHMQLDKHNGQVDSVSSDAAVKALFILSEKMKGNRPALVFSVLQQLGGGGHSGIDAGLKKLQAISLANPGYASILQRVIDRCDFNARQSVNDIYFDQRGVSEYVDFLNSSGKKISPNLLHAMILGGVPDDEIIQFLEKFHQSGKLLQVEMNISGHLHGVTGLLAAAHDNRADLVQWIHQHHPNEFQATTSFWLYSPLHLAVANQANEVVKWFVNNSPDAINSLDYQKRLPLHEAIRLNNTEAVVAFYQADPDAFYGRAFDGGTAINHIVKNGQVDTFKALCAVDATVMTRRDKSGLTPLYISAKAGRTDIVEFIVKQADMRSLNNELNRNHGLRGKRLLAKVAGQGNERIVKALLDAGADKQQKDWLGRTPAWYAEKNGHKGLAQLLRG